MYSGKTQGGLSAEEIRTTAEMARLQLDESELAQLAGELSGILAHAELLKEIDVSAVPSTKHAVPMSCPLRGDLVGPHDPIEAVLRNAPAREATFFSVPAVFASTGAATGAAMGASDDYEEG
ncbi:MAG: Asp-tRNA(Asn)/Glu-tRNA(Gln) amidotransferase subunit GatC [Polyangia bacterium]